MDIVDIYNGCRFCSCKEGLMDIYSNYRITFLMETFIDSKETKPSELFTNKACKKCYNNLVRIYSQLNEFKERHDSFLKQINAYLSVDTNLRSKRSGETDERSTRSKRPSNYEDYPPAKRKTPQCHIKKHKSVLEIEKNFPNVIFDRTLCEMNLSPKVKLINIGIALLNQLHTSPTSAINKDKEEVQVKGPVEKEIIDLDCPSDIDGESNISDIKKSKKDELIVLSDDEDEVIEIMEKDSESNLLLKMPNGVNFYSVSPTPDSNKPNGITANGITPVETSTPCPPKSSNPPPLALTTIPRLSFFNQTTPNHVKTSSYSQAPSVTRIQPNNDIRSRSNVETISDKGIPVKRFLENQQPSVTHPNKPNHIKTPRYSPSAPTSVTSPSTIQHNNNVRNSSNVETISNKGVPVARFFVNRRLAVTNPNIPNTKSMLQVRTSSPSKQKISINKSNKIDTISRIVPSEPHLTRMAKVPPVKPKTKPVMLGTVQNQGKTDANNMAFLTTKANSTIASTSVVQSQCDMQNHSASTKQTNQTVRFQTSAFLNTNPDKPANITYLLVSENKTSKSKTYIVAPTSTFTAVNDSHFQIVSVTGGTSCAEKEQSQSCAEKEVEESEMAVQNLLKQFDNTDRQQMESNDNLNTTKTYALHIKSITPSDPNCTTASVTNGEKEPQQSDNVETCSSVDDQLDIEEPTKENNLIVPKITKCYSVKKNTTVSESENLKNVQLTNKPKLKILSPSKINSLFKN